MNNVTFGEGSFRFVSSGPNLPSGCLPKARPGIRSPRRSRAGMDPREARGFPEYSWMSLGPPGSRMRRHRWAGVGSFPMPDTEGSGNPLLAAVRHGMNPFRGPSSPRLPVKTDAARRSLLHGDVEVARRRRWIKSFVPVGLPPDRLVIEHRDAREIHF